MYKKTILQQLKFKPSVEISEDCENFLEKILQKNPENRLGSLADSLEIMSHPWFSNINWSDLMQKKVKPPYQPYSNEKDWIKNFDPIYTKEKPMDSICWIDPKILEKFKKEFDEFGKSGEN